MYGTNGQSWTYGLKGGCMNYIENLSFLQKLVTSLVVLGQITEEPVEDPSDWDLHGPSYKWLPSQLATQTEPYNCIIHCV